MAQLLHDQGHQVQVLDNFSSDHADALSNTPIITGDLGDTRLLNQVFQSHAIDAVMHFAAFIQVGESVREPAKYYDNHLVKTLCLLDAIRRHEIRHFIFSSTAAVYGMPEQVPIKAYGRTKLAVELAL